MAGALEYSIAQFVLQHKEALQEKVPLARSESDIYQVYLEQYADEAARLICDEVAAALNLDPEQSMHVCSIVKQIAPDLLVPRKEE